jgi:chromosome segregation and condensation protein ScpB
MVINRIHNQNQSTAPNDKGRIEAIIFSSPKGVALSRLLLEFPYLSPRAIKKIIEELASDYTSYHGALALIKNRDDCFQFQIRHSIMLKTGPNAFTHDKDFTPIEIQVLAYIAYNQPIASQDIIDILGTRAKRGIKVLMKKGFITECRDQEMNFSIGNEEISQIITGWITSPYFAEYFDVPNDLPTIREYFESALS